MKKSAIILGASAAVLAIAGAFTTKGNSNVKLTPAYTVGGKFYGNVDCNNLGANTCKTTAGVGKLYTAPSGATLKTNG
jgi:hypothetical protein